MLFLLFFFLSDLSSHFFCIRRLPAAQLTTGQTMRVLLCFLLVLGTTDRGCAIPQCRKECKDAEKSEMYCKIVNADPYPYREVCRRPDWISSRPQNFHAKCCPGCPECNLDCSLTECPRRRQAIWCRRRDGKAENKCKWPGFASKSPDPSIWSEGPCCECDDSCEATPIASPTPKPTAKPTAKPTPLTLQPTSPTLEPTPHTLEPTSPTLEPTPPTHEPTSKPTLIPTGTLSNTPYPLAHILHK